MSKNLLFTIIIFLNSVASADSINNQPYTAADLEKIAIIVGVIILIFSPSKFRVTVIGTFLGLALAYLTYKYFLPILISL